jgi:excisionase family DNA binding protein
MSIQKSAKTRDRMPVFFSVVRLAARWDMSYPTIVRMIQAGRLKGIRVSKRWKVHCSEVERIEREGMAS